MNREKIGPSLSSFAVPITFRSVHPASGRSRRDVGGRGKVRIIYSVRYIYYPYTTPLIIYIIV